MNIVEKELNKLRKRKEFLSWFFLIGVMWTIAYQSSLVNYIGNFGHTVLLAMFISSFCITFIYDVETKVGKLIRKHSIFVDKIDVDVLEQFRSGKIKGSFYTRSDVLYYRYTGKQCLTSFPGKDYSEVGLDSNFIVSYFNNCSYDKAYVIFDAPEDKTKYIMLN